jgi:hypothetical protein
VELLPLAKSRCPQVLPFRLAWAGVDGAPTCLSHFLLLPADGLRGFALTSGDAASVEPVIPAGGLRGFALAFGDATSVEPVLPADGLRALASEMPLRCCFLWVTCAFLWVTCAFL